MLEVAGGVLIALSVAGLFKAGLEMAWTKERAAGIVMAVVAIVAGALIILLGLAK